jgi:hypothetical protein
MTVSAGPSATWRESVLAALPLLLFAAGAFLLAYFLFQTGADFASSAAPLWSLFAALGVVTTGGGVAVLAVERGTESEFDLPDWLAGRDRRAPKEAPPTPFDVPEYYEGPDSIPSWVPPARRIPAVATARSSAPRVKAQPSPAAAPSPAATEMDRALEEMQATLERLAAEGRSDSPASGRRNDSPTPPQRTSPSRPKPPAATDRRSNLTPTPISPLTVAPLSGRDLASRAPVGARCTSCTEPLSEDGESRPCVVCGQRLCWMCELKTLEDGHYLVCDRCSKLSGKSPEGRRAP